MVNLFQCVEGYNLYYWCQVSVMSTSVDHFRKEHVLAFIIICLLRCQEKFFMISIRTTWYRVNLLSD